MLVAWNPESPANTHFDFAMCTIDLSLSGFMEGSDLMTVVRNDCSVASAGNDDRNSDICCDVSCRPYSNDAGGTYNRFILGGFQTLAFSMFRHNFMGNGIVIAMIPVLDILFCKGSVRRFLVPNDRVRPLSATRAMVAHLNGHWAPRLHSPFIKNEHMCGLFRL